MVPILMPNYYLRTADRKKTASIIMDYSFNCDPTLLITNIDSYKKKCILSKKQKKIFDIYKCMGFLDYGAFDDALKVLMEIEDAGISFDDITNVLFMKTWCDYFYLNNQNVKMKQGLLRLKDYITKSSNDNIKQGSKLMYQALEAKYYILVGENLEKARNLYSNTINMAPSKLNVTKALYELALIDIKQNNYHDAMDKLNRVVSANDKLYVVRRAKDLINMYNNK